MSIIKQATRVVKQREEANRVFILIQPNYTGIEELKEDKKNDSSFGSIITCVRNLHHLGIGKSTGSNLMYVWVEALQTNASLPENRL